MSEQSKQPRFGATGQAPRAQAPSGATHTQAKKPTSLADLLRASATPLSRAVPFPERVAGVVPSIRAPKPRPIPGPTPKRKKKLPASIEQLSFLPPTRPEIPDSADGSAAASPFHITSQQIPVASRRSQNPTPTDGEAAEGDKIAQNGAVSPFSIDTQAFDTTIAHKEQPTEEQTTQTENADGIIHMRPRTTIVPKGGLSGGNSPFSNVQPQAFVPTSRGSQATTSTGSSPFAIPTIEEASRKREQPTSVSAPFSLNPPAAPEPITPAETPQAEAVTPVQPKHEEILYVPATEEEPEQEITHRPILPLQVEPVFTAPPTTTHLGSWEHGTGELLSDSEASAEAEEALRAADYGYAADAPGETADDFAWYTPEEQTTEESLSDPAKEPASPAITEVETKAHYHYPTVSKAYDRAEDIPLYKRQITCALVGGWLRVLAVLAVFAGAITLSMAELLSISLPTILSPTIYPMIYRMADLELLLLGMVLCLPILRKGLSDLFHGAATPAAFFSAPTLLFLLVQITEISYGYLTAGAPSVAYPLCSAPILFGCLLAALGHVMELHRQNTIFRHVAADYFAYAIEAEPDGAAYMRETSFPTNVAAHAAQPAPCSSVSLLLLPLLLLVALACGLMGGAHYDSVSGGLYVGALALAACFPIGRILMRSGSALLQTLRSLATYGSCALSEVDAKKLAATDSLVLSEAALFAESDTQVTRILLASEDHDDGRYILQAVGDAIGGSLRIGLENRYRLNNEATPHTTALAKTGGDEDGVELLIDNGRVLHIGRHTFMLRHRMAPLTYTEDDARAERQDKLQVLFVAEEGTIFAKLFLHSAIPPARREDLLSLAATGKQILIETDSPFFDEERLRTKLGEARAPIYIRYKADSLCAPRPKPTQGGLLAATTDGAIALLTELSAQKSSPLQRVLRSTCSVLLGIGSVAAVVLAAPLTPFAAPILCGVQLLHLPLSKRHPKRRD